MIHAQGDKEMNEQVIRELLQTSREYLGLGKE